jgi:phosphatidylglycerol---prolipoprotein diacylglyceryl transferase
MPPGNRKNSRRGSTAKSRQQQRATGRPRTSPGSGSGTTPGNNAAADGSAGNSIAGNGAAGLTGITPSRDVLPDLTKLDKLPPGLKAAQAPAPAGLVSAKASAPSATAAKAAKTAAAEKPAPPKAARQEPTGSKSAERGERERASRSPGRGGSEGPSRPGDSYGGGGAGEQSEPGKQPDDSDDEIPQWAAKALEELLAVTYWLNPGEEGDPFTATISFSGQRADVTGKPGSRDTFFQQETVEGIVPGSGPVAITAEIRGINSGEWTVSARPAKRAGGSQLPSQSSGASRVPWPRRIPVPADSTRRLKTSTLLFAKVPGVIRFAYPILVCLGALAGLGIVTLLLNHSHYAVLTPLLYSLAAIGAGVIGGKSWYIAVHHGRKMDGWCIQGFVAGAAIVVGAAAIAGPGVPAGVYLAAAAPALLIGMGIGRPACFWAGCCTGRPTAARWGIWSSDRRLDCRRAPAQLFEAATAFFIGVVLLVVVLLNGLPHSGPVGVAGLAAYTLVRQLILGLRAEPRTWRYGRPVTATAAVIALIASVIVLAA